MAQSNEVVIPLNVTKRILDNGMTVLIKEDHAAPVATVNVWVKTGYFNETDEWTGISHLLEHMFFKGTPTRPVGAIQDEVKSYGGYWNAGTIYDHTNYYIVLPSSETARALDIEADALINSTFPEDELEKEQEVVIQEIMRKYDNPSAMAWERMIDLAFSAHHIRRWRMGTPGQVRAMDRDVLVGYYTDRYRPENIVLVVAGDVDAEKVMADVERLFGAMPRGELKRHDSPAEPPLTELRYRQDTSDITQSYMVMGFHAPPALHPDGYAVEVLAALLGSGKSSRLYRELKQRQGLVNSIDASYYALPDVGVFYIDAELDSANLEAARNAVFVELERIRRNPPDPAELEKIKTGIEYGFIAAMEDVSGQSNTLAYYEALGDYNLMNEYLRRLRAVTPEDVQRAAGAYLSPEKCAIQEMRPKSDADATDAATALAGINKAIAEADFAPPASPAAAPVAESQPTADADAPASRHTLSNGITVIVRERHRLPLVSAGVYFPGGRASETPATAGLTKLMFRSCLKGTTTRSAEQIQDMIDALGAGISPTDAPDYAGFVLSSLSRNFEPAAGILADVILNPAFPENEIDKERDTQLAEIIRNQDSMFSYPFQLARRAAFGGHPYGMPGEGFEDSLKSLTHDQVRGQYGAVIRPEGALIVVVGDVDTEHVIELLESNFAALAPAGTDAPGAPAPGFSGGESVVTRDKAQSAQAIVFPAPPASSLDAPALRVLRDIASGMGGRLYDVVREKNNLAYTVVAYVESNKNGGAIVSYAATLPENEEKARDMMLAEWKRMAEGGISQEEFETAQRFSIGIYQIGLQGNAEVRAQYARNYFMGFSLEYIDLYPDQIAAVTVDDVRRVAAQYAAPASHALGVVRSQTEK